MAGREHGPSLPGIGWPSGAFGHAPGIAPEDVRAIRAVVRSFPLASGPITAIHRAEIEDRPSGCDAADVFVVCIGACHVPLAGCMDRLIVAKRDDGSMAIVDHQHLVS